ncbi:VOC family protein [Streptomyces sp. NPDC002018]|uniref:VOC family protein n=1 Tax=Streptomyces sp. NPDC002018 TaxID=3364629 RepID=UPI0036775DAB
MATPHKLSHVVLQTNRLPEMRDWYCRLLGAHPVFENELLAFLAYDDEHHRIGLLAVERYGERPGPVVGLQHFSFTYDSLDTLLEHYEGLKKDGVLPVWTVDHGPTISFYYADPEANWIELQVDVFKTNEEVNAFMEGEIYHSNPIGVVFDPDDLAARYRAGEPLESLTTRRG